MVATGEELVTLSQCAGSFARLPKVTKHVIDNIDIALSNYTAVIDVSSVIPRYTYPIIVSSFTNNGVTVPHTGKDRFVLVDFLTDSSFNSRVSRITVAWTGSSWSPSQTLSSLTLICLSFA